MNFKILKSLDQTNPSHWNSILTRDHLICSYEHLIAVEKSHINDCDYRYIMIYENNKLIAHTCIYSISFDLDIFNKGKTKEIIGFIRKYFYKDFLRMKIVECGSPTALGSTISMVPNAPKKTILSIICKQMKKFAKQKKVSILLLRDFYEEELNIYNFLILKKFRSIQNLPNSILSNRWETFGQYLDDLTSRYRKRIRRYLESIESNNIQVIEVENFSKYAERFQELWFETYSRAKEYQREILTPEYFINMDTYLGNRSKAVLFKKVEEIIGFILVLKDEDTLRPMFCGMDYRFVRQTNLYFNFLCQIIKMVIQEKNRFLEIGITSYFQKKEFGAEIIPLYAYMKHLNPFLNIIIPKLFMLFSPPITVIPKHVFNRRFFERIYTNFKIRLWTKGKETIAHVYDISESGIRLSSSIILKRGRKITIEFCFHEEIDSFMMQAKVMRIKKADSGYEVGLMFETIHQPILDKIKDFINYIRKFKTNDIP